MKFLPVILSIYMFFIGLISCTDAFPFSQNNILIVINSNNNQKQDNDYIQHQLCICSCCLSNSISQTIDLKLFSNTEKVFSNTTIQFDSGNFSSIWQPPKLV